MNTSHSASQSGIFNPRILCALALCSVGILLGAFSLAATPLVKPALVQSSLPPEITRATTSQPPDPATFLSTSGSNANRLPPGVPLPPGAHFSVNGQDDPALSRATAGFPRFAGWPLQPATANRSNPLGNPAFANQQPTPLIAPLALGTKGWSIADSPNGVAPATFNLLTSVTCVSATECWAVGYYNAGSAWQTLIEHWDGTSWAVVSSPNIDPNQDNFLTGVTCASASDCWAVGHSGSILGNVTVQTLIERWDGTAWAIVSSPNTAPDQLNFLDGVTCVSGSECWAVGDWFNQAIGVFQTLIERWDGTAWAIVNSDNTSTTQSNLLSSVTCVSASECWAVGEWSPGDVFQTLTQRWDGTSWTIVTSPNTAPDQFNLLLGVTCVSASECWAVGYVHNATIFPDVFSTLIERWDGTAWTIVSSPNTNSTKNYLTGVTCASASECWAVGYYDGVAPNGDGGGELFGGGGQPLIERWNGASWAIVNSPTGVTSPGKLFSGVTCASSSECWAIGTYFNGSQSQTLIERWNATSWAVVSSPNSPPLRSNNFLSSVTCASASDCWAVGDYDNGGVFDTLTEHWDGTAWAVIGSPNVSQTNVLASVACASASECWAVGYYTTEDFLFNTLIERWDGTAWTIVSSPNGDASFYNFLTGVTCVSESECWAVGDYFNGTAWQTLIERWDGTAWAIVSSPNTNTTQNFLTGVTCVSASECWAVGNYFDISAQTLIERWDGTAWTIVSSPNTATTQDNVLSGVACASASDCWTVGNYNNGGVLQTLIERWDGTAWVIVSSPDTSPSEDNVLSGVACALASNCSAVGSYNNGSALQTLIERWNGVSWDIVSSPDANPLQDNVLAGVTCTSGSTCWAVGSYNLGSLSVNQTLIERKGR